MRDIRRNGIELYHSEGLYEPVKLCDISGEINKETVDQAIKNLIILDNLPDSRSISIFLNSEGGCFIEGSRLYDAIRSCKRHVIITVLGQASSMASIILQAADTRRISKNSFIMIHIGEEGGQSEHVYNKKRWDRFFEEKTKWMKKIYLERIKEVKPRFTSEKLDKLLVFDTILNGKQALELGLIDKIV